ncbi:MAG: Dienelactone hydrolase [Chloroflexi bacterium AL-W]|nr:Dienelactone hydrolase [Chloroflexi bacterium AL-N1]NOK67181.1 Dienelactone hydrolase [Chloroflexi bacterium AL-N10]NOK75325.1 Dienelactone hydrolase [Chloroflexi bacterium AL-N5]NOK82113.1 Dienelactone hydrolase [Chloroflexi bacterium AL-W]NOK89958.1 Dienelactone hydrolase [Chloroflexi bacterium AL-N15]
MRILRRILIWGVSGIVGLILILALSIPIDALLGGGRVDALTNTRVSNDNGPEIAAYVARPETPGPHPAVIMIHEWWGLKAEITEKANALAQEGYVVIAPDTFRGNSTSWIPRAIYQVSSIPPEQVNSDLDAVFTWLASQPDVQADRIAVMGFCYGGRTSLLYSLHNNQIAATGIFYGMATVTPAELATLPGPVLGIFGGSDTSIPIEEVRALEEGLRQASIPHQISIYDGQPHAFVTSIEAIGETGPQQDAWNELLGFLRQTLQEADTSFVPSGNQHSPQDAFADATTLVGLAHHRFVCGW